MALGGRGLWAHSGLRVKGQKGWVNLRTFPPPRDQISHSLRILWGLQVWGRKAGFGGASRRPVLGKQSWADVCGETAINSIPPDNLLRFPQCTRSPRPGPHCSPWGGWWPSSQAFLGSVVVLVLEQDSFLSVFLSVCPSGCWNVCSLCDGHGDGRCWALGVGLTDGEGSLCLPEALLGPGQGGKVVPSPGQDPGHSLCVSSCPATSAAARRPPPLKRPHPTTVCLWLGFPFFFFCPLQSCETV